METVPGQIKVWNLLEKMGEGDGGEIFRVESLLDKSIAILKRPQRKAFPSDIIRQAGQIDKEASILEALSGHDFSESIIRVPVVMDKSKAGNEYTDRFFIVLSPASGLSLAELYRLARIRSIPSDYGGASSILTPLQLFSISRMVQLGRLPDLLLLRALVGVTDFLEAIHTLRAETANGEVHGVLWNDIKPDHFLWDPVEAYFTLIDWGNAQFVEADGITKDRQHSRLSDFSQFLEVMEQFLSEASPDLVQKLEWPDGISSTNVYSTGILPLRERANKLLGSENLALHALRQDEIEIISNPDPNVELIEHLGEIHRNITSKGEVPDHPQATRFYERLSRKLIEMGDFTNLFKICGQLGGMAILDASQFALMGKMAKLAQAEIVPPSALLAGLDGNWSAALWDLCVAALGQKDPEWWAELSSQVRQQAGEDDTIRPLIAVNRLIHALKSTISRGQNMELYQELVSQVDSTIIPRWTQLEPDPPDAGIEYSEVENILDKIKELHPESAQILVQSLEQPRAQVNIALDAWRRQDFDTTARVFRQILFWDPDRIRLLQADKALQKTISWLTEVRSGIKNDEPLLEFITRMELTGREFRNQIASAPWLDDLLEAQKQLRKGEDPTDVLLKHPISRDELDWLISLEPRRPLLLSSDTLPVIERQSRDSNPTPSVYGVNETELGVGKGIILADPLDTWASEARGSSARLFIGTLSSQDKTHRTSAVKLMRPDRVEYALPLFKEEAKILSLMHDVPGVVSMIETGYFKLDQPDLPPEDRNASAASLRGKALRYGLDSVHNFLSDLEIKTGEGWIPYIAIEKFERDENLLLLCDTGYTNGRFLPTLEGLVMGIQICGILEAAHARNILYRDHKILHYYWRREVNGISMIDWNVSKHYPGGLSSADTQFDLVQFGARTLHYLLVGRSAPGALPLGPNRPEEIESAARSYSVQWSYDDQRLPKDIKDLLQSVLTGEYTSAIKLKDDLLAIFTKLSTLVNATGG